MAKQEKLAQKGILLEMGISDRIEITKLLYNEGQIDGVPKNPRYLKENEHDKLKKSLTDSPEFLEYKPLMVYPLPDGTFVTICGNMRLRVANELRLDGNTNFDTVPCFVLKADTPIQKIKEYAIKDNVQAGNWDWDDLANDGWDTGDLTEWGVDCSFLGGERDDFNLESGSLEELQEGGFQSQLREETNTFQMSFVMPLNKKPQIDSFVKKNGKDFIVNKIVEMCCDEEVYEENKTEVADEIDSDTD